MLILQRKKNERVVIECAGRVVDMLTLSCDQHFTRLGFSAPADVLIYRPEAANKAMRAEQREAVERSRQWIQAAAEEIHDSLDAIETQASFEQESGAGFALWRQRVMAIIRRHYEGRLETGGFVEAFRAAEGS